MPAIFSCAPMHKPAKPVPMTTTSTSLFIADSIQNDDKPDFICDNEHCQQRIMSNSENPNPRRSYRGIAHAERSDDRRRRLIAAGVQVFGSVGVRRATVKAICVAAALTERYFYESFPAMEVLLVECYRETATIVLGDAERAAMAAGPGVAERMRAALNSYFRFIKTHREAARLVLFELVGVSEALDPVYHAELRHSSELIGRLLFEGPPQRSAQGLSTELLAAGVMGAVYELAKEWANSGCTRPRVHLVNNCMALALGARAQWQASASNSNEETQ
jgi:AcrR family transcriptional regulator